MWGSLVVLQGNTKNVSRKSLNSATKRCKLTASILLYLPLLARRHCQTKPMPPVQRRRFPRKSILERMATLMDQQTRAQTRNPSQKKVYHNSVKVAEEEILCKSSQPYPSGIRMMLTVFAGQSETLCPPLGQRVQEHPPRPTLSAHSRRETS